MALPYEGDSEMGRKEAYSLTGHADAVRPIAVKQRTSLTQEQNSYQFENEESESCWQRTKDACDRFFASICPDCITSIPSIFLILLAILIVLFVVCSIPLIFFLTYGSASAQQGEMPSTNYDDNMDVWPASDPGLEDAAISNFTLMENSSSPIPALMSLLPKNVAQCRGMGFVCASRPHITIGLNAVCDGIADCPDGSDEANCEECLTSFSCPRALNSTTNNYKLCLRAKSICDAEKHCPDGSDEAICQAKCAADKFKCSSIAMCLPKSFVCDGERHCPRGDDEAGCENKCANGSKWCKTSKQCIPKWKLCDGVKDCDDGTDEEECDCKQCSGSRKMLCKATPDAETGFCFSGGKVCDGVKDCPNGEDEDGCPGELKTDGIEMVKCNDDKMYSKVYACMGLINACEGVCQECDKYSAFDCGNKHCIVKSKVCNGIQDCPNGQDEMGCTCPDEKLVCPHDTATGKRKCIDKSQRCDGFVDCPDGDDEKGCESCSNANVFKCRTEEKCIARTGRCDGRKHCTDGSDEENCSADLCAIHPFSMYLCSDGKSCFRKNEVCSPYSNCPGTAAQDKGYCAIFQKSYGLV